MVLFCKEKKMSEFERIINDSMMIYNDAEWDPIMGDAEDHIETDDEWLDNFWEDEDLD
jgi:hypothetical protein